MLASIGSRLSFSVVIIELSCSITAIFLSNISLTLLSTFPYKSFNISLRALSSALVYAERIWLAELASLPCTLNVTVGVNAT